MSTSQIRVVVGRVGQPPVVEMIDNGLKPMQAIVGGYIERVVLDERFDLWCDEEFLIKNYQPNRLVTVGANRLPIHGDFFIARYDRHGNTLGLTEKQAAEMISRVNEWPQAILSLV
jgi:hypothetical protein